MFLQEHIIKDKTSKIVNFTVSLIKEKRTLTIKHIKTTFRDDTLLIKTKYVINKI